MNQRGLAESTQWAVLAPTMLALVLGLVQLGVWLHARTVVSNAAAAVADLRVGGPALDSTARAAGRRIAAAGGLGDVDIRLSTRSDLLVVTVSGRAPLFFDLGQGRIAATAVLPLEEVTR
ncbi:MAG: TadE/TadG family type IV pilus assembly protein [Propionicimonas sp.]